MQISPSPVPGHASIGRGRLPMPLIRRLHRISFPHPGHARCAEIFVRLPWWNGSKRRTG